ncbi:unnamed protein product [Didymodactylos carnosus]|uniref:KY-like immunoglobulin-like domain-containing protein n=1 Tax=Didymodactylos carnosus TaxID=1234261 RepID=A0A8S2DHB7_9BILA|nr:unnamed protein product [Didymodactylos carnosus]CAF3739591.1 unnamed protein product [Didymodactylos carnosus]
MIVPKFSPAVSLLKGKPYTIIILKTPLDVDIIANLQLHEVAVKGGERIVYDKAKGYYKCYFAPQSSGLHKIHIYAKRKGTEGTYPSAIAFDFDVKGPLNSSISYPKTWEPYFNLNLEVLHPRNSFFLYLKDNVVSAEILIRAPAGVALIGSLKDSDNQKVTGGDQVYFNNRKSLWRCQFAPPKNGKFVITIFAKKETETGTYPCALEFELIATHLKSPISYPKTWQCFHDYQMEVVAPQNSRFGVWPPGASYCEILIRAPDDIQLTSKIAKDEKTIENGDLIQYDAEKELFHCLFAPRSAGTHTLTIFAKRTSDIDTTSSSAVQFGLNVTELKRSIRFPVIYTRFETDRCRIFEPLNGVIKRGSNVHFHWQIPNASEVKLMSDSEWKTVDSYENNILKHQLKLTNEKEVTVYGKYKDGNKFTGLAKYNVE